MTRESGQLMSAWTQQDLALGHFKILLLVYNQIMQTEPLGKG